MTDPAIVEVATRAMCELDENKRYGYNFIAETIITAVTPLIEAAALERIEELEAALRAIKKLGRTRGYGREALAQIAARALKQGTA